MVAFKPEVYVVVDELLTEVLRGQLSLELQAEAIERIIIELLDKEWGPTDLGLCKTLCRTIIAPRSPIPLRDDFLARKCLDQGEPVSKGVKGVQHKLITAFAEIAYKFLGGDLSDKTAAMSRAALHSHQRTQNTEYRRVFKALIQHHHAQGGTLPATLTPSKEETPSVDEDFEEESLEPPALEEKEKPAPPVVVPMGLKPTMTKGVQLALQMGSITPKDDDDLGDLYIPTFDDFKDVFKSYPFMRIVNYEGNPHLGLGYLSGRLPQDGTLIRRNCAVKYWDEYGDDTREVHFKKLLSQCGVLEQSEGETRRFIKLLPLKVGMVIRAWSNLKDQPDIVEANRYSLVDLDFNMQTYKDEESLKKARAVLRQECLRRGTIRRIVMTAM